MIVVENLVKRYGARAAVRDLSFQVQKGEIVGFLGPNGAGKTTTLRVLAGFLAPTSGSVRVCGHDLEDELQEAKSKVGYMPETVPLYPEMRVAEYLAFRAELKGVPRARRRARVDDVLDKTRVTDVAHVVIGHLSKGYRQRVGLADALVADPPLLILDEPTAGLDPNQIRDVRDVIAGLGGSHTVLLSTHILSEVEATCARAIVIARGRLVAEGTLAALKAERGVRGVRVRVSGDEATARAALAGVRAQLPALESDPVFTRELDALCIEVVWAKQDEAKTRLAAQAVARALVQAGLGLYELAPLTGRLEDVFAELTGGDRAAVKAPPADEPPSGETPS
ncbi:MAG TPA: ABC transporter ATP-binding protein [Polyangiaceae bacterium]|nr:ABC transporter ATP-binding protein [Polyangiaceae bacterium]